VGFRSLRESETQDGRKYCRNQSIQDHHNSKNQAISLEKIKWTSTDAKYGVAGAPATR